MSSEAGRLGSRDTPECICRCQCPAERRSACPWARGRSPCRRAPLRDAVLRSQPRCV